MKNNFYKSIIFLTTLFTFCSNAHAFGYITVLQNGDTIYYQIINNTYAQITYPGTSDNNNYYPNSAHKPYGNLIIPDSITHNGTVYPVIAIGDYAFYGCTDLSSVIIPNTITYVGKHSFHLCTSLSSVIFGDIVHNIDEYAFYSCMELDSLNTNNVNVISKSAFAYCSGLTYVNIENSCTSIGGKAFENCSSLNTFLFNADSCSTMGSTTLYGYQAVFNGCDSLTSIIIGDNVRYIPNYAFSSCYNVTSFIIPYSVNSIGNNAFPGNSAIFMQSPTPPEINSYSFGISVNGRIIHIPCGAYLPYSTSQDWNDFYLSSLREPDAGITLTVISSDSIKGTAQIEQQSNVDVSCDSSAIITAMSNFGYHFDYWSNGRTANPDTLHLISDSTISAYFAKNRHTLTITSNDSSMGTLIGSGEYYYGDTVLFVVQPDLHYHVYFVRSSYYATADESQYQYQWTGDDIQDTMWLVMPNENITIDVEYRIDQHVVSLNVNDENAGAVSGDGLYDYGASVILIAAPREGYHFTQWSNGVTNNPYAITVTQDTTLTAFFMSDSIQGVNSLTAEDVVILTNKGKILVANCNGKTITIHDGLGRLLYKENGTDSIRVFDVPLSGIYLVNIDKLLSKKIVVIK